MKPILIWVGGKSIHLEKIIPMLPKKFNTYYEPFLGGGAIFFHIRPKPAVLCDSNEDLINFYKILRDFPEQIYKNQIKLHQNHTVEKYYAIRERFNKRKDSPLAMASMFIYLNKKAFRGLCRYSQKGNFNVPIQNPPRKDHNLTSLAKTLRYSKALENCKLLSGDFEKNLDNVSKGDLVILDPPYLPINKTSCFTAYTPNSFDYEDHLRLVKSFKRLTKIGAYVVLFNNNLDIVKELYRGYNFSILNNRKQFSNLKGEKRIGSVKEIIIMNYGREESEN